MTTSLHPQPGPEGANLTRALAAFRPLFADIAAGAIERETTRRLPRDEIRALTAASFGALRVPRDLGGFGLTLAETATVLLELATADTNLVQALRGHFAFVEDRLTTADDASRVAWCERFVAGEIVGNGWTEIGAVALGDVITKVRYTPAGPRVTGTKYYSTGSIFAEWIDTYAQDAETGEHVIAVVNTASGVSIEDDWDGFGQRTTGSGTATYKDATVAEVTPFASRFRYQTALYQWFLLIVQAGAAQAAVHEAAESVRGRARIFSHGNAPLFREDPQILQVIGEAAAAAYAASALIHPVAVALDDAFAAALALNADAAEHGIRDAWRYTVAAAAGDFDTERLPEAVRAALAADRRSNEAAELHSAVAQVAIWPLAERATGAVNDALGASGTSTKLALDRHWRNARTAASHNPRVFKARIVGDHVVNDAIPPFVWGIGASPAAPAGSTDSTTASATPATSSHDLAGAHK
ncbi:acyl-CoA dehydrogenase family protein [Micrococcales bacterium 31B]|nr:acyl-CoA dehydrogenase family protein [Micrococcales bacterium 31B]